MSYVSKLKQLIIQTSGMKEYFFLQYRLINRNLRDFGLTPVVGYILIILVFIVFSLFLFYKTIYADYILVFCSLSLTSRLSEVKRNDFLKLCFGKRTVMVRIIENMVSSIPFISILVYQQCFIFSGILISISVLLVFASYRTTFNLTIPTPFSRRPFEFTVGFRNTYYLFVIAYCITVIAVFADNFNLGIFSLLLVFFSIYSYYLKPENEYYVWIYALSAKRFLFEKIKTGLAFSALTGLPIILLLGFCFNDNILPLLAFFALGLIFLLMVVLMKYSEYPDGAGILQVILITLAFSFPPMLVVVIPLFIYQSINKLYKLLK